MLPQPTLPTFKAWMDCILDFRTWLRLNFSIPPPLEPLSSRGLGRPTKTRPMLHSAVSGNYHSFMSEIRSLRIDCGSTWHNSLFGLIWGPTSPRTQAIWSTDLSVRLLETKADGTFLPVSGQGPYVLCGCDNTFVGTMSCRHSGGRYAEFPAPNFSYSTWNLLKVPSNYKV